MTKFRKNMAKNGPKWQKMAKMGLNKIMGFSRSEISMTQILRELRNSKIAYFKISEALNFDFGRFLQFLFGQKSEFFASQILREIKKGESKFKDFEF